MIGEAKKNCLRLYVIKPSRKFLRQQKKLSPATKSLLAKKFKRLKINPFSHKPLQGYVGRVFRIRFSDRRNELRLLYKVENNVVYLLEILERKHEYKRK